MRNGNGAAPINGRRVTLRPSGLARASCKKMAAYVHRPDSRLFEGAVQARAAPAWAVWVV
jgi:hypothetical protein